MIEGQQQAYSSFPPSAELNSDQKITSLGAQILHVALAVERMAARGLAAQEISAALLDQPEEYNPQIAAVVARINVSTPAEDVRMITVRDLRIGMLVEQDIHAVNGQLLVPRGQEVTFPVLARLRNFAAGSGVVEPFRVRASLS
jgi:hypothetical protein